MNERGRFRIAKFISLVIQLIQDLGREISSSSGMGSSAVDDDVGSFGFRGIYGRIFWT